MSLWKKAISALLCLAVLLPSSAAVGATEMLTLSEGSRLTLDREGSGYIRGVWGTPTAAMLKAEFSNSSLSIRTRNGKPLADGDRVSSDSVISTDGDRLPVIIYGDCDRNGAVSLADVSVMLKYMARWQTDICLEAADLNNTDRCDLGDAAVLLKRIAGWDVAMGDAVFPEMTYSLSGYTVVRPADADPFEVEAAHLIYTALRAIYGNAPSIITDSSSAYGEILVGDTSRPRSGDAVRELEDGEWTYSVPSNVSVVIAGSDGMGTYEAAEQFLFDTFGYVNKDNIVKNCLRWDGTDYVEVTAPSAVTTGKGRTYTPERDPLLAFMNTPARNYTIIANERDTKAALLLQKEIRVTCGAEVDIITPEESDGSPAIRICTRLSDGITVEGVGGTTFGLAARGDDIIIDATNESNALSGVRAFIGQYMRGGAFFGSDTCRVEGAGSNLLFEVQRTQKEAGEGVQFYQISYSDRFGLPVEAYLVTVEDGASRIMMGTKDNGYAISGAHATVKRQMIAAEEDGIDVICGINADFFYMGSTYTPNGLCVKDGNILKENDEARPWIAVMKDGTMDCGTPGESRSKISMMKEGFGASHVLFSEGVVYPDVRGTSFADIRHPRTAMGYDEDGTVYLLVVDGRHPKYSNGASLLDLAVMLMSFGATNGVNLDGGGSSTMILEEDGEFVTKNSPSDGALRSVFNSVIITQ